MIEARRLRITGIVQGVGFRPFVARQARARALAGWVANGDHGVEIHVEGSASAIDAFEAALRGEAPPAARIDAVDRDRAAPGGFPEFTIRPSERGGQPTARISPDLPVCDECLRELFDAGARRFGYPYINCTNCGPRYSIVRALPYDRERTTMAEWPLCAACAAEYGDPGDRRLHAEPVACPSCGPRYRLEGGGAGADASAGGAADAVARAARLLREGAIVAVKGLGGYHLACDAANAAAVRALRERKFRKRKPFAVMARDMAAARALVDARDDALALLASPARPIVLAPARASLPDVAPGHRDLGVMLPYAPIHHLLFASGAPDVLVMTSANRSSEPIAFEDADARERLHGLADAFLVGERRIARRVDDSVVSASGPRPIVLRRGRGYAPGVVARLPTERTILALGADLKNTITLVAGGRAIMSQHIGDLEHVAAHEAFRGTIHDLTRMYDVDWDGTHVVHDLHPDYASTAVARGLRAASRQAVQHHRAHVASVAAERGALEARVVGVAFDGAGYGDDGTIWGGEFFVGSVADGLARVASLRPFPLPGGDAAARLPLQAAAGLLSDAGDLPDLTRAPFCLTERYEQARRLARSGLRTFTCTSAGRLFDTAAALLGFTRAIEHEGEAAAWLENIAWRAGARASLPYEIASAQLDFRPALRALAEGRLAGSDPSALARAFHEAMAEGICQMVRLLADAHGLETVVLSGGTFQNALLVEGVRGRLEPRMRVWLNQDVPPNDGGISLGQAALASAALQQRGVLRVL